MGSEAGSNVKIASLPNSYPSSLMSLSTPGFTSTGGAAGEIINGGPGDDQLFGNGGDDRLDGREGNDLLDGGDGNDSLSDGEGNNHLIGGKGDDYLLNYGPGNSILEGGEGNDRLVFGRESSRAFGGAGNDVFTLRDFNATGARSHILDGGDGDDYFDLDIGKGGLSLGLTLTGGAGRDIYWFLTGVASSTAAPDIVITDFKTGTGGDLLSVAEQADMVRTYAPLMLNPFVAGFVRFVQNGPDTLFQVKRAVYSAETKTTVVSSEFITRAILRNVVADSIVADNIEGYFDPQGFPSLSMRLDGTALPDHLHGGLSGDVIFGYDGADTLNGFDGNDELHGGGGDDQLMGDRGNDILYGDDGKDSLTGAGGDDALHGGAGDDSLIGNDGNDLLDGGGGNDNLYGGNGEDVVNGGDGDDSIDGGFGSDTIDGGNGIDTVTVLTMGDSYEIRHLGGMDVVVVSGQNLSETDKLVNVERIQLNFEHRTLALDIDGNAGQAYRLYQAAFNRTPDNAGLSYWIGALDKGTVKLNDIAAFFISSDEFKSMYGASPSNSYFLDKLYDNILHRKPDPAGFNYWLEVLDKKYATATELLASFSESPENVAALVGTIGQGIWLYWE